MGPSPRGDEAGRGARGRTMIAVVRNVIRRGFELIERPFERLYGPRLNPLAQLGALGFFFYWIVAVTGIYLFIFFDTGIERAYQSVEHLSQAYWYHAGVMRSLHRYASDLMVVMVAVHLLREFAYDHYRGVRWYSWFTGLPIIWLLYASGITGYWLVWDKLAQYVAISTSELLDWLPIFGEPIARNFVATGTLTSRFFTLMVFMHIATPLFLLFIMWVHILRISRPKVNPPRALAAMMLVAITAVALWKPALSQGHVDLAKAPADIGLDWFFLSLYPLGDVAGKGWMWGFLAVFSLMLGLMPWLPPFRRARAAVVDLAHCNGCTRCAEDCHRPSRLPAQGAPRAGRGDRRHALRKGPDPRSRLRSRRRRRACRRAGAAAVRRHGAAFDHRLHPEQEPGRRRGGRRVCGKRLLPPARRHMDRAALRPRA
jgi:quinol-cytochrome oxidoreductase complex cytochrome b subunit